MNLWENQKHKNSKNAWNIQDIYIFVMVFNRANKFLRYFRSFRSADRDAKFRKKSSVCLVTFLSCHFHREIPENRSFIKLLHPTDSIISRIQKPVEINIITAYTCSSPIHASIRVKHSRSMIDTARRARERHGWLRQTATVTNASVLVRCVGPLMKLAAVESVEMRSLREREKERNRLVCRPEVWDSAGKKRRRERLENLRAPFVTLAESISRLAER